MRPRQLYLGEYAGSWLIALTSIARYRSREPYDHDHSSVGRELGH